MRAGHISTPALLDQSSTPFPAKSSELLPCGIQTVPENYHRVGSGRDRSEPIARLRNSRASGYNKAHFLYGLGSHLLLCWEHYVLARISSKCRCAKRERQHDACTSTRPAEHATGSASCFHAPIVILFHIWRKFIRRGFGTKNGHFRP